MTTEPEITNEPSTEANNPPQDSSLVDEFRKRYSFRLKDKQISDLPPILQDVVIFNIFPIQQHLPKDTILRQECLVNLIRTTQDPELLDKLINQLSPENE